MNDRFLSRGKLKADNLPHKKGDWVFGYFVILKDGDRDVPFIYGFGEIIPETLGGCTGFTDKSSKKIFDGDIIKNIDTGDIGVVRWYDEHGAFIIRRISDNQIFWLFDNDFSKIDIIGNIYDNKQMLERVDMPVPNDVFQPVFQPVLKSATPENFELMQG